MPLKCLAFLGLFGGVTLTPALACISEVGADRSAQDARERDAQLALVEQLVSQADSVVIARAVRYLKRNPLHPEFEVQQVLSGAVRVGARIAYQSAPLDARPCITPSQTFPNTFVSPGAIYLLYAKGNKLLRAAEMNRSPESVSFEQEKDAVLKRKASNKSLERSRDR